MSKLVNAPYVFDTGMLYLYFAGDKRAAVLFHEVRRGVSEGFTTESNAAELFYKTCERLGRDTALIRYNSLRDSSLVIEAPDESLTLNAGQLMCSHRSQISLTDAYIISLAKSVRGTLYTTDPRIDRLKLVPTRLLQVNE